MTIFLTHSYFYQLDPKQWNNKTPYPPLATITALSLLQDVGYETTFYDVALDESPNKCIEQLTHSTAQVVVIYDDGFNYLTKMCLTNMRHACFALIRAAKAIGAQVIVSSSDATDHADLYHATGADIVIHGEGERTLLECLDQLKVDKSIESITGISYLNATKVVKTPPKVSLKELDELPSACWSAIDIPAYKAIWDKSKFPFTLNISTTRGCPFKCNWCAKPIYGNRYNSRSPERVVEEMKHLHDQYGVKHFWITDDIFGLKPGWVTRFNGLMKEHQLSIHYKIQSRADLLMKDETIQELAESGLEEVWIGAESGSQAILDAMDKGITIEEIKQSTQLLQKRRVRVAYFLQFGYLGETAADIEKTIQMVKTNRPDDIGISVSYPLPGTKFYDTVKEQLGTKSNWEDSDDLELMFKGTYNSAYYKSLQRYVHHTFRFAQGVRKLKQPSQSIAWRYTILAPYNFVIARLLKYKLKNK